MYILTTLPLQPLTRSVKVQKLISTCIRGRRIFLNQNKLGNKKLLNVGCGPLTLPEFINLDYSWQPSVDVCWDITRNRYPFADNTFEGIYTEHCLEHIPYAACIDNLKEFYRILQPGGTLRIIVPDGELYIDTYQQKRTNPGVTMPYGETEPTGMFSINRIFRNHGHQFIYDYETMYMLLQDAQFRDIRKESFRKGRDPRLLVDHPERQIESLYVEASK